MSLCGERPCWGFKGNWEKRQKSRFSINKSLYLGNNRPQAYSNTIRPTVEWKINRKLHIGFRLIPFIIIIILPSVDIFPKDLKNKEIELNVMDMLICPCNQRPANCHVTRYCIMMINYD